MTSLLSPLAEIGDSVYGQHSLPVRVELGAALLHKVNGQLRKSEGILRREILEVKGF